MVGADGEVGRRRPRLDLLVRAMGEDPVRETLDVSGEDWESILSGEMELDETLLARLEKMVEAMDQAVEWWDEVEDEENDGERPSEEVGGVELEEGPSGTYALKTLLVEPVDGFNYGTFDLIEDLCGCVRPRPPGNFSHHLRHDHHTDVVPTQLPTARPQPRYLSLRAFEGAGERQVSHGIGLDRSRLTLATHHYGGLGW